MIIAVIPAKGGSKRLPHKNMVSLNGKPMLQYSIDYVKVCSLVDELYVSTDSDDIENFSKSMGVNVIRRPVSLGGDTPIIEVYRHALSKVKNRELVKIVVGVQPDHPDRNIVLEEAINLFKDKKVDRLISTDQQGKKNGAHYILSRSFLDTGVSIKDYVTIDNCTNVHFKSDLVNAGKRLNLL